MIITKLNSLALALSLFFVSGCSVVNPSQTDSDQQATHKDIKASAEPDLVEVNSEGATSMQGRQLVERLENSPLAELSDAEKKGLLLMREEEKLARDVYLALYDKWEIRIFSNIGQSEATHTQAVKALLDKYTLEDPAEGLGAGRFKSDELQALYTELVETGLLSLEDALKVGAKIEDLDIKDLKELLSETKAGDIRMVYEQLLRGSRNHMRAFTRQLNNRGLVYTPEFISLEEYKMIIDSDMERGSGFSTQSGRGRKHRHF